MNERIKALWKQAGGHYNSGNQHTWPEYTIDDPEKFAELIAYECMDIALGSSHREDDMGAIIANKIKKHFGVE